MKLLHRILAPSPHRSAQVLGRRGAETRIRRARERRCAFHREMRARLGLPPATALEPRT